MDLSLVEDKFRSIRRQFSNSEKRLVLSLVLQHPILLDKRTKRGISNEKMAAWRDIHARFIASDTCNGPCTSRQLKKLYFNIKFLSKRDPRRVRTFASDAATLTQAQESVNQHITALPQKAAESLFEGNESEAEALSTANDEDDAYASGELTTPILTECAQDGDSAVMNQTPQPALLSTGGDTSDDRKMAAEEHEIKMKLYHEKLRCLREEHEGQMQLLNAQRELCQLKKRYLLNELRTEI